jgi:hypothetical protein
MKVSMYEYFFSLTPPKHYFSVQFAAIENKIKIYLSRKGMEKHMTELSKRATITKTTTTTINTFVYDGLCEYFPHETFAMQFIICVSFELIGFLSYV